MSHYLLNLINISIGSFIISYAKKNTDFYASLIILGVIIVATHLFGDQFVINYIRTVSKAKNDNCCICLDALSSQPNIIEFSQCHHQLHRTCAVEYVSNLELGEIRCPMCRL
jgi:hypothetical protein